MRLENFEFKLWVCQCYGFFVSGNHKVRFFLQFHDNYVIGFLLCEYCAMRLGKLNLHK